MVVFIEKNQTEIVQASNLDINSAYFYRRDYHLCSVILTRRKVNAGDTDNAKGISPPYLHVKSLSTN